jgi:glyoxylase-like metal-dependent hydrolase (beta-lactamase superfamily II)
MHDLLALTPYVCPHCGFWQRYFAVPPDCPMCTDYRHPLPADGWDFQTPSEAARETRWHEPMPGVWQYWNPDPIGVGPTGFVIVREGGNVAFEGAGYYSDAALDHIASIGGVRFLSFSHSHVVGAQWQLDARFAPEIVVQQDELPLAQALRTAWPFELRAGLAPGLTLIHTGRHTPGHSVLHWPERRALFVGDCFKFRLDSGGRPTHVSTHRAYDAHLPLSHGDLRHYLSVLAPLDFDTAITPWEVVPRVGKRAMVWLFTTLLRRPRPTADFLELPAEIVRDAESVPTIA